jgi:hypothetical protein
MAGKLIVGRLSKRHLRSGGITRVDLIAPVEEGDVMGSERRVDDVLEGLVAQARRLWGEEDAERQRPGLRVSAEHIVAISATAIPVDLEPRFF